VFQLEDRADFEPEDGRLCPLDAYDLLSSVRANQAAVVREGEETILMDETLSEGEQEVGSERGSHAAEIIRIEEPRSVRPTDHFDVDL
jgi:hypothetical protein